jgi:hypothetical protein
MIRVILDQNNFKREYPKPAATYEEWLEEIQYKRNNNNIEASKKILFDDGITLSTEDMLKLVKKLIAVYNASKKAKARS